MASTNLDLLRAVAVLCVLAAHTCGAFFGKEYHHDITWHVGQLGVLMFFVHTALVLMQSLDRSNEIRSFYLRRAFRIYPLAIVCVLFAVATGSWSTRTIIANLTLTQNLLYEKSIVMGLWSLPVEVQMYLLLPLFHRWMRDRWRWVPLLAWCASVPIALIQMQISGRLNIASYAPCFLAGALAWRLLRDHTPRFAGWFLALPLASLVWFAGTRETEMPFRWLFCLTLGLAIPLFRDIQWKPLNEVAATVAKYSYGIYLSHGFILEHTANLPLGARIAVCLLLIVCVPVALYHLVEAPMIRVGKAISTWRPSNRRVLSVPGTGLVRAD